MSAGLECSGHRLIERIGGGNFCEVWLAEPIAGGPRVVVKRATDATGTRMLASEAAAAVELAGVAGVVPVSDLRHEPCPHVVMPWLGAQSYRDQLELVRGGDDRARAMATFLGALRVVAQVHARRVAHGDLKPENILVGLRGAAYVIDFGLARAVQAHRLEQPLVSSLASVNELTGGTLDYMPPEAIKGAEPTRAGDVYALGTILHEVLLGRRPDKAVGAVELERRLPAGIAAILTQALAYEPRQRYRTAGALLTALEPHESALTAMGGGRIARNLGRAVLAALAAGFVALRYFSVLVLGLLYLGILVAALRFPPVALAYLPFVMLHATIRWEGPESPAEAAARMRARPTDR